MRILSARIFSKSFGGKNKYFLTAITYSKYREKIKKAAHASFGGKIKPAQTDVT